MGETEPGHPNNEMENDGDEEDDSYAKAYMDDDDAQESDDEELAEMLAKVQSIQQVEGRLQLSESGDVKCNHAANILENPSPRGATPRDLKKSEALPRSPLAAAASSSAIVYRSQDGIKTVLRNPLSSKTTAAGTLLGIKKSAVYEEKLLQAAISTNSLERLKQRTVAAAPATIGKRIETLSVPAKKSTARKFARDDEEQHCRFKMRKNAAQRARDSSRYDFDSSDTGQTFISRMEAAEKNRQKKLELSRGENDYNARLDKKSCPRCGAPQSYSEFRDKKKKCQSCGVEFRHLNAWGDIERSFTARLAEASRSQAEKKEQIYAQIAAEGTGRFKANKTAKQVLYEKRIAQKANQQSFLERNYKPNNDSKTKKAQLELEAKRKAYAK